MNLAEEITKAIRARRALEKSSVALARADENFRLAQQPTPLAHAA